MARFPYLVSCLGFFAEWVFRVVCTVLVLATDGGDFICGRERESEAAIHVPGTTERGCMLMVNDLVKFFL